MLTEFDQLKEVLKPLFRKAFHEQFKSFSINEEILTNAKSKDELLNFLKVLDYYSFKDDFGYDGAKKAIADEINFELEGFTRRGGQPKTLGDSLVDFFTVANESWRIDGAAEKEANRIQQQLEKDLIQSSRAPVSAIAPAPARRYAGPPIRAPRLPTNSANVTPNNNQSLKFAPPRENVNPLVPKGAAGSSNPASKHSTPNRSAPRKPTNATTSYRAAILNQVNPDNKHSSDSVHPTPPKGAAGYKAGR